MKHEFMRKAAACSVAAAFAVAASAGPAAASDRVTPGPSSSSKLLASGQKQVQQLVSANRAAGARHAQGAATAGEEAASFFRTPKGIAVLALVAAGTAYMFYSKINDRVHSPIRQ